MKNFADALMTLLRTPSYIDITRTNFALTLIHKIRQTQMMNHVNVYPAIESEHKTQPADETNENQLEVL